MWFEDLTDDQLEKVMHESAKNGYVIDPCDEDDDVWNVYDKQNDNAELISFYNSNNKFCLLAVFEQLISNINENYRHEGSEDDPEFLNSDFVNEIEDWFEENIKGYKGEKCKQYYTRVIEFECNVELTNDELENLQKFLTEWIDNCYNYAW